MLGSPEIARTHLDFHAWATHKLVDAASQLSAEELERDFATAQHSVLETLTHLFGAERMWLARVEGNVVPRFFELEKDKNLPTVQNEWPLVLDRWRALAAEQTQETLESAIAYNDMKGNAHVSPLWQIILHVVNHGTHHRGQVTGFLRAMGHTPPSTDLIYYYREKS
jgi:uncharacterized damage-inducible protein DinB